MSKTRKRVASVIGGLLVMGIASTASAQDTEIIIEESNITGRVQKPEAFYVLQHAQLDYESLVARPSFLEEIERSVEEDPF